MLLALDVGNSNVTIGVFRDNSLIAHWRLKTNRDQTSDEWGILLRNLFDLEGLDRQDIGGVMIGSVVPSVDAPLAHMARRYFSAEALFLTSSLNCGLKILYDNPRDVGADRIANGVAAFARYGGPCVVVDLGTAITFDAVSASGDYLGGIICAGIGISIQALFTRTARLPMVDFRQPGRLIGTNTVGSMQSGLYYGILGAIDGILERLLEELGPQTHTIATGGQAELIVGGSRYLKHFDDHLTLEGLRLIWERNLPAGRK